jgi:hypothetical protein
VCRMELQVSQWLVLNSGTPAPHTYRKHPTQRDAHAVHGVHATPSVDILRSVGCCQGRGKMLSQLGRRVMARTSRALSSSSSVRLPSAT